MSEPRWSIPENWVWVASGEISRVVGGGTPNTSDPSNFSDDGIPWITPADLSGFRQAYISKGRRDLSEKGYQSSSAKMMPAGTVLYSSRAPIGYCVIAANEISTSQGFKSFIPKGGILPEYIRYYLLGSVEYAESRARGTTFKELSGARASQLSIPLAPLAEQKRIVAKLDNLISHTARARAALDQIPVLIEKYKEGLFELAFSGRLTEDWRDENANDLPVPLEKIRKLRAKNPRLLKREAADNQPEYLLPPDWRWISPDEIASDDGYAIGIGPFGSDLVRGDYRESGVRLVFVRDIRRGYFETKDAHYITSEKANELRKHIARAGDVLITKMGDPPGDACLFPTNEDFAVITADCIKITPHPEVVGAPYLSFAMRSPQVRSQIKSITAGVAQQKVSLRRFRKIALPIPPIAEQIEIVRRIETAFSWLDRVVDEYTEASKRLAALGESILQVAFRGELVPQNSTDEPVSMLLERIETEKKAIQSKPKSARKAVHPQKTMKRGVTMANLIEVLKSRENWISASDAAQALGVGNGATSDTVEGFYNELREHLQDGLIEVERRGNEDWLRLTLISRG